MRTRLLASLGALALVGSLVAAPGARAYESIRRDSPLGRRLAETARLTGAPVELLLGPRAWRPVPVVRDSAERAARRAAAAVRLQAEMSETTDVSPAILFAGPPTIDSLPPAPPGPVLADSLTAGLLSFAVGDLDGDGLPDLAGVQAADSVLDVRRNLGGGVYAPVAHYPLASGARKVALGDFNGDGRADVAVGNLYVWSGAAFSVLSNLGDGTLGTRRDGFLPSACGDVLVSDLERDGRDDLVFTFWDLAGVVVVPVLADGTLGPPETIAPGGYNEYFNAHQAAVIGDLDGDGKPDIVLAYRHGDCFNGGCVELAVYYGRGDRTFEAPVFYQGYTSNGLLSATSLVLGDADGDHRADLLVSGEHENGGPGTPRPALIRNAGDRHLEAPTVRDIGRTPWDLSAAHFHTGGPEDLVVSDDVAVTVLRNRGDGSFAEEADLAQGALLDITDLDSDGLDDVVSASGDSIEIRLADGGGGFAPPTLVTDGRFVATGDFTGDHRRDLAVLLPNDDVGILAGDGSGGFAAPQDAGPVEGIRFPLVAADLDGDGLADLASAWSTWTGPGIRDTLAVWWGTGSGFTAPSVLDLGPVESYARFPMDLKAGDFNGDGRPDLAVVIGNGQNGDVGNVRVVPNLGGRVFAPPTPALPAGEDPFAAAVADFDGDGLDDLAIVAATTSDDGRFSVFSGSPDGMLASVPSSPRHGTYFLRHWAFSLTAGDFDGDGRSDVAAGCGAIGTSSMPVILAIPNISPRQPATPAMASLVSADARPDHVTLVWEIGGSSPASASIERRTQSADWVALASVAPDGAGRVHFEDHGVVAGGRYAYRLRLGSGAGSTTTGETWIEVPAALAFALEGARPNPTSGPLAVAFTLPSAARATLEVLDVTGRRVRSRTIESPAVGRQLLSLEGDAALAPGLYFVRLRQEQRTAQARVAVVR
jgi:hypothetical protein